MILLTLAWRETRAGARSWIGLELVVVTVAALLGCCANFLSTARTVPVASSFHGLLIQLATMVGAFVGVVALGAIMATVASSVDRESRRYALWQLLGISTRKTRGLILMQVLIVAVVASIAGVSLAALVGPAQIHAVAAAGRGGGALPTAATGIVELGGAGVATVGISLLAAVGASRRVSNIAAIEVVLGSQRVPGSLGWARIVAGVVCAVLCGALVASLFGASGNIASLNTIFACILAAAVVCLVGSAPVAWLVRVWPRVVPDRCAPRSWICGRAAASANCTQSAGAILPVLVGILLIGSIFAAAYTQRAAMIAGGQDVTRVSLDSGQVIIMLGGPALIALVAGAAASFQGGEARRQTAVLYDRMGLRTAQIAVIAVVESFILVSTALIVAAAVIVLLTGAEALALAGSIGATAPVIPLLPLFGPAAAGFIVLTATAVIPLLRPRTTA